MKNHDPDAPISVLRGRLLVGLPGGLAATAPPALVRCGASDGVTTSALATVDRAEIERRLAGDQDERRIQRQVRGDDHAQALTSNPLDKEPR